MHYESDGPFAPEHKCDLESDQGVSCASKTWLELPNSGLSLCNLRVLCISVVVVESLAKNPPKGHGDPQSLHRVCTE